MNVLLRPVIPGHAIVEPMRRLSCARVRDVEKTGELARSEAPVPFDDVGTNTGSRGSQLIPKTVVAARRTTACQAIGLMPNCIGCLPDHQILITFRRHAPWHCMRRADSFSSGSDEPSRKVRNSCEARTGEMSQILRRARAPNRACRALSEAKRPAEPTTGEAPRTSSALPPRTVVVYFSCDAMNVVGLPSVNGL